jgi:mannose-6-phosphate isomerase-like protein (cupin superfamily)
MEPLQDTSDFFEVERQEVHARRPGFHITEIQLLPLQKVPWHFHSNITDTFYVLDGRLKIYLQDPKESVQLEPGETYAVPPRRPHLVTNGGEDSTTFLVLQGLGEYDYVPYVRAQNP